MTVRGRLISLDEKLPAAQTLIGENVVIAPGCVWQPCSFQTFSQTEGADVSNYGPYPAKQRNRDKWLDTQLVDPASARIEWSDELKPADGKRLTLYGYLVHFKVNARNRFGGYTGKQSHAALIRDGLQSKVSVSPLRIYETLDSKWFPRRFRRLAVRSTESGQLVGFIINSPLSAVDFGYLFSNKKR
jgi:hypothetical protein